MKVPGWVAPPWQWSTGWPGQGAVSWVVSSGGVTTSMSGVQARPGSQAPGPEFVFEEGDVVVLLGRPANLALAEEKLLRR